MLDVTALPFNRHLIELGIPTLPTRWRGRDFLASTYKQGESKALVFLRERDNLVEISLRNALVCEETLEEDLIHKVGDIIEKKIRLLPDGERMGLAVYLPRNKFTTTRYHYIVHYLILKAEEISERLQWQMTSSTYSNQGE